VSQRVPYLGFPNHVRLANERVELLVSTDYGPRVIRFAPIGGANVFGEISPSEFSIPTTFDEPWRIYGGHRLWYAPEIAEKTYWPDNGPIEAEVVSKSHVVVTQPVEGHTKLQKQMDVALDERTGLVTVVHRIFNRGQAPLQLAAWALSVMRKHGRAIFPNEPRRPHPDALQPVSAIVLWPYTDLHDPRYRFGKRFTELKQDPSIASPQKIGFINRQGWAAYHEGSTLFVVLYDDVAGTPADIACNTETFTNGQFLEIETLGPLVTLAGGEKTEHTEHWMLFDGVELSSDEDAMASTLAQYVDKARAARRR
jgi:hypothetical protein